MPTFEKLMRLREGVRKKVYLDTLRKPTVGIGHLVLEEDKLKVGDAITEQQVSAFFKVDGAEALAAAKSQASKAGIKDAQFIVYLASVNFQLGAGWRRKLKSKNVWPLILDGKYAEAAEALNGTKWQKQTPKRVKDFQSALLSLKPAKH